MTIQARLFRHCHYYSTPQLIVPAHRQHGIATSITQCHQLVAFIGSKRATYSSSSSSGVGVGVVGGGDGVVAAQRNRLRRSVHFVPADNTKFLNKALSLGADTIVFDLEDSVKDKHVGRERLRQYLESIHHQQQQQQQRHTSHRTTEMLVRINPLSSEIVDWKEDLEIGFMGCGVDGFMIPKVESHEELLLLDEVLTKLEKEHSVGRILVPPPKVVLPIATETPMAVLNIASIAKGPRVCAITWGCEDLSAELGSYGTRHASSRNGLVGGGEYLDIFRYCRSMCLLAAKAANVQAIDGIYQNVRDITGLGKEASDAKYMGFDGKLTLHPDQISVVHSAFEPTQEEYEEANHIVSLWENGGGSEIDDGRNTMKGSLEYNGKMIDLPHYVRAKKVVARKSTLREPPIRHETTIGSSTTKNATQTSTSSGEGRQSNIATPVDRSDDVVVDHDVPRINNGKYFEDLHPGMTIRHFLTRTVTEADNVFFTCLTLNPAPIHLDHELSNENTTSLSSDPSNKSSSDGTGKPLFNSIFTLGLLVGMSVPETTHGTTVANLGFSEVVFPKPVYPGDTLRAETTIVDKRESKSRPTQGIVTFQHRAYNQRGELVCKATRQALMKKRP